MPRASTSSTVSSTGVVSGFAFGGFGARLTESAAALRIESARAFPAFDVSGFVVSRGAARGPGLSAVAVSAR